MAICRLQARKSRPFPFMAFHFRNNFYTVLPELKLNFLIRFFNRCTHFNIVKIITIKIIEKHSSAEKLWKMENTLSILQIIAFLNQVADRSGSSSVSMFLL